MTHPADCPCACHNGSAAYPPPCDMPGGCGLGSPDSHADACPGPHWRDTPPSTSEGLCVACRARYDQAIEDLPELYVHLYLALQPGASNVEHVSGSREAPLPLVVEASVLMSRITDTVTDAVVTTCTAARLSPPQTRGRGGPLLSKACATLAAHRDTLIAVDVGQAVGLITLAGDVRRYLGQTRGKDRLVGVDCPKCAARTIVRWHGTDTARCESCSGAWPYDQARRWLTMMAQDVG